MSRLDYSKWDHIEDSSEEEVTDPYPYNDLNNPPRDPSEIKGCPCCSNNHAMTPAVDEDDDDGYGPLAEKELEEHFNRAVSILRERRPDLLKEHNMSLDTFKVRMKQLMRDPANDRRTRMEAATSVLEEMDLLPTTNPKSKKKKKSKSTAKPMPDVSGAQKAKNMHCISPQHLRNPDGYKPAKNKHYDVYDMWGMGNHENEDDMQTMMERMIRMSGGGYHSSPEKKQVERLMQRKLGLLEQFAKTREYTDLCKSDYVLRVSLKEVFPEIWREVRVPGSFTLHDLHHRVLIPAMGWSPFYHAYVFNDQRDGAVFGPKDMPNAVDMTHMSHHGYESIDSQNVTLAQVVQEKDDLLAWTYDLGDRWLHFISVVDIVGPPDATGNVDVLCGAMACPPEDSMGIGGMGGTDYNKALHSRKINMHEASHAANYREERSGFDPHNFSLAAAKERVSKAQKGDIGRAASCTYVPGVGLTMNGPGKFDLNTFFESIVGNNKGSAPGGAAPAPAPAPAPGVASKPAPKASEKAKAKAPTKAVRRECGNCTAADVKLFMCSACETVMYCSRACQLEHWKRTDGHKAKCKEAARQAKK